MFDYSDYRAVLMISPKCLLPEPHKGSIIADVWLRGRQVAENLTGGKQRVDSARKSVRSETLRILITAASFSLFFPPSLPAVPFLSWSAGSHSTSQVILKLKHKLNLTHFFYKKEWFCQHINREIYC